MHIQQLAFTCDYYRSAVFPDWFVSRFNGCGHEHRHIAAQLFQLALKAAADFIDGATGVILVDEICGFDQFRLTIGSISKKYAVLNVAFRSDDNEQNALFR